MDTPDYATEDEFFRWLWREYFGDDEREDAEAAFEKATGKFMQPGFSTS
jgi:hypothetical protein